ncbi:MAG: CBS domain-containing protein [Actinobacteria bacterium]|nr:CBS domain-containing protein [Actinomycetota bacterium]
MEKKIRDIMHRGIVTCEVNTPAEKALEMMVEYDVPAITVIDEMTEVCGVISEKEIIEYYPNRLEGKKAEDIMKKFTLVVHGNELVAYAVNVMIAKRIDHLVIVQGGNAGNRPIGVLSMRNIVDEMYYKS